MNSDNPNPTPGASVSSSGSGSPADARLLIFVLAGIVAGGGSWRLIEEYHPYFTRMAKPQQPAASAEQSEPAQRSEGGPVDGGMMMMQAMENAGDMTETTRRMVEKQRQDNSKDHAFSVGLLGLVVTSVIGLAAGLARKSVVGVLGGLVLGAVFGAALGAGGGWSEVYLEEKLSQVNWIDEMLRGVIMHFVAWTAVGIAVSLAVGLSAGKMSMVTRLLGITIGAAVLTAVLFTPLALAAFPNELTEVPIPRSSGIRMLWTGLGAVLLSCAAGLIVCPASNARSSANA